MLAETEKSITECQINSCCQRIFERRLGYFRFYNFLIGVLFIATALVAFRNPVGNLFAIAIVFGVMAILSGLWSIAHAWSCKLRFLTGLVEIAIGVILLAHLGISAAMVPFVFSVWFIFNSITNLSLLPYAKNHGSGQYWFFFLVGILGLVIGVAMLFHPIIVKLTLAFLVGFYLMIAGITHITLAFSASENHTPAMPEEKNAQQ
jgi:Uncharacterized conserved protein